MNRVHFIGLGGIGVSAIARMMIGEEKVVTGSDQDCSPLTEELAKLGVKVFCGHRRENLPSDTDLVVYSIAVPPENPELLRARELGIAVSSYPEILGEISRDKFTIAVAGTHGKTTTTAMIAKIFLEAGLDPTVVVGSLVPDWKSNFRSGASRYFIVEACEFRRSFLHLRPRILVITNIDNDHLDYYRDLDDIRSAFAELAAKVPAAGRVITEREYSRVKLPIILSLIGEHNQRNGQAAIAAAAAVGVEEVVARRALADFRGTWRRLELKGRTQSGVWVYDDYAHHPTEIKATLAALRPLVRGRLFVVFQPHLYSRTRILFGQFAASFAGADEVLFTPVYAAREPVDPGVDLWALARAVEEASGCPARALAGFKEAAGFLLPRAQNGDAIITLGAGDIYRLADLLVLN